MPNPALNVPFPFVLPTAAFAVADRLIMTLMNVVDALTDALTAIVTSRGNCTRAAPEHAAQSLRQRLLTIIATVIRLDHGGTRTAPRPKSTTPADPPPEPLAPHPRPDRGSNPSRPVGWLLAALPDIAPAIAADLAVLLADPAFATLLAAAPTLQNSLRPFLRGLGLTPPPIPSPPPPDAPLPNLRSAPASPDAPPPAQRTTPPRHTTNQNSTS